MSRILVVDDEQNICELLTLYLVKEGYTVETAGDGEAAVQKFKTFNPDLVLLDIMLPKKDGWAVCREIRQISNTPIIMLSAKGETFDKVLGLELGADDYVTKPFDSKEVMARIKTVLRRAGNAPDEARREVEYHNLYVSLTNYKLVVAGKQVEAPPKEIELLYHLAKNPNRVFTRDQLLSSVWDQDYSGETRTVDVHVGTLRTKLGESGEAIRTVRGVGYRLG